VVPGEDIDRPLVLKVGVHHGPAIAMTANDNLDYFGRTVNLAARVADQPRGSAAGQPRGLAAG
jgi:class 3 adenylate cyclase